MTEQLTDIIEKYFDNELDKHGEAALFSQLSANEEAREQFKGMLLIRNIIEGDKEVFPQRLDEQILKSLPVTPVQTNSAHFLLSGRTPLNYLGYGLSAILIIIMVMIYSEVQDYRSKVSRLDERLKEQNQTIEMLYNSLPPITIRPTMNN